jgi:hypothetical protein
MLEAAVVDNLTEDDSGAVRASVNEPMALNEMDSLYAHEEASEALFVSVSPSATMRVEAEASEGYAELSTITPLPPKRVDRRSHLGASGDESGQLSSREAPPSTRRSRKTGVRSSRALDA